MSISNKRIELLNLFQKKYNLEFGDINLLNKAFCHTSYTNENNINVLNSYERLEFLGDAVLKLSISKYLYNKLPDSQEGNMSALRAKIVSDSFICVFAQKLDFEHLIILGRNEKKLGGAKKESILACAFEALLGAIFLEYKNQGFDRAYNFLIDNFEDMILDTVNDNIMALNPKATLQEYTQGIDHKLPEYVLIKEEGAQHNKTFFVEVIYNNKILGSGCAKTIKEAQQNAAKDALIKLQLLTK